MLALVQQILPIASSYANLWHDKFGYWLERVRLDTVTNNKDRSISVLSVGTARGAHTHVSIKINHLVKMYAGYIDSS